MLLSKKSICLGLLMLGTSFVLQAQDPQAPLDGIYTKSEVKDAELTQYAPLREADVMWNRRVWRTLDLGEKINLPFKYPKGALIDVILDAVANGELTAYDAEVDDEFSKPLTPEEVGAIGKFEATVEVQNPETGLLETTKTVTEFDRQSVTKYWLKEEWFFDKQRSVFECRIIGIAPVYNVYSEDGVFLGEKELVWINFPEARTVFINSEVFNRHNDGKRLSYDDIFMKRMFSSTIFKVSNVYDRRIVDYKTGLESLYEAESFKQEIFNYEHDLWEF